MSDKQILALFEPGSYEVVPHDGMRRTIAQRLTASMQTVPHFYLTMDCDIGRLLAAREEINASAPKDKEKKPLYKLSVNDFVIKATGDRAAADSELPMSAGPKAACSSTSIPTSASPWRCPAA